MQVDTHQIKEKQPTQKRPTLKPQWNFKIPYIPTGDVSISL